MGKKKLEVKQGQQYERLEVIREVEPVKGKRRVLCKCECGGETPTVDLYQLIGGKTKSCGCMARENLELGRQFADLTGQTFGRLKVLRRDGDKLVNKSAVWLCECSCSPDKIVPVCARDLVSKNTTSCGCSLLDFTRSLTSYNEQHLTVDGAFVPLLRQKVQTNNKTGTKGVSIRMDKKGRKQYVANITIKGKRHYLGIFATLEIAVAARRAAEEKYHAPYIKALEDEHNGSEDADQDTQGPV